MMRFGNHGRLRGARQGALATMALCVAFVTVSTYGQNAPKKLVRPPRPARPPQVTAYATGPRGPVQVAGGIGAVGGFTIPMTNAGVGYSRRVQ